MYIAAFNYYPIQRTFPIDLARTAVPASWNEVEYVDLWGAEDMRPRPALRPVARLTVNGRSSMLLAVSEKIR